MGEFLGLGPPDLLGGGLTHRVYEVEPKTAGRRVGERGTSCDLDVEVGYQSRRRIRRQVEILGDDGSSSAE